MRRLLAALVLLALQIGGVLYVYHRQEIDIRQIQAAAVPADAPRMWVPAHYSHHGYIAAGDGHALHLADTALFGRSLLWGTDWQQHVDTRANAGLVHIMDSGGARVESAAHLAPLALRATPPPHVCGAQRIPTTGTVPLAVFWRRGADGLHTICRLEARDSSEDTPREGELRTLGELHTDKYYNYDVWAERVGDTLYPRPLITLGIESNERNATHPRITYPLTMAELGIIRRYLRLYAPPTYTMELALPPDGPPVPVDLHIDGRPAKTALKMMRHAR